MNHLSTNISHSIFSANISQKWIIPTSAHAWDERACGMCTNKFTKGMQTRKDTITDFGQGEKHFPWERDNTVNVQKYKTEEVQWRGSKKTNSFRTIYMARKTNGLESLYFISSVQIPLTRLYDLEAVNKLKIYSYYILVLL